MTATNETRRWRSLYAPGVDAHLLPPTWTVLEAFDRFAEQDPSFPAQHYFGATMSRGQLADLSRRIARVLADHGVGQGDRVAISLQNTPMFAATLLATWRLRASVVPINPMLRPAELSKMVDDSEAGVIVAHPQMAEVIAETATRLPRPLIALWSLPTELAGDIPVPFTDGADTAPAGGSTLLEQAGGVEPLPGAAAGTPQDAALITYTSGTTGPSKGAIGTQANLAFQAVSYEQWFACDGDTSVLTVAPLFHITGLGAHLALALGNGHPLVLTHRFEPRTVLGLIDRYKPTFAIGAITAFISMRDAGDDAGAVLANLPVAFSGGAPVPEMVVERYEAATGRYIHNIYGLTETTSACISTPLGVRAPVDAGSGALSVGVPMGGVTVTIVDDHGHPVPAGTTGEIVVAGPQVAAGYWNKPEETANAFSPLGLKTGDVGIMDEDGWVYVVDRKKDMVVVSGYKVWPRDVEDVLYKHPAVMEAAVVGAPDEYRGETVHAYVTLRRGMTVTTDELRLFCREHLSAYKVPTEVFLIDELPKTSTGKIMRRELRKS